MAEQAIIKDEYLPHIKDYCRIDYFHIQNLTRLLQIEYCDIKNKSEKIKELLNNFQLKYGKFNQYE